MAFSIALLVNALFAVAGIFGLVQTALKVPLPQKWVWIVGFGLLAVNGICNALYQYGGKFIILLPLLYPLQTAIETTATLGLVIGAYSALNKNEISSHWYSLPTGCTPITMLAQYVPTYYVQISFIGLFIAYILIKDRSGAIWFLPFGLLVGATVVRVLSIGLMVLSVDDLVALLLAASTLCFGVMCTGGTMQIGKTLRSQAANHAGHASSRSSSSLSDEGSRSRNKIN